MRPISRPTKRKKRLKGFLLIEILTALAILGVFVVVTMLSLARCIAWNYEAKLRLRALNAATTTVEYLAQGRLAPSFDKKIQKYTVTVQPANVVIDQEKNDKLIPVADKSTEQFKTVVVTAAWKSAAGEKQSVQLLTGITTSDQGDAL